MCSGLPSWEAVELGFRHKSVHLWKPSSWPHSHGFVAVTHSASSKHRATPLCVGSLFYDPQTLVNGGKKNQCSISVLRGYRTCIGTDQRGIGRLLHSGRHGGLPLCALQISKQFLQWLLQGFSSPYTLIGSLEFSVESLYQQDIALHLPLTPATLSHWRTGHMSHEAQGLFFRVFLLS